MLKTKDEALNPPPENWLDRPLLVAVNLDWEKALYGLLIALAVLSRLWDLGARVMSHDETVHIQWSWYLFQGRGYEHTPLSHGPFLFHATALNYYLFGDNDFSARLIAAVMGIILVALPYALRHWLGRRGALVASFLFLISPSLLYYSRYIRHDIPIIVWSLIAILAIFRYLEDRHQPPDEEAASPAPPVGQPEPQADSSDSPFIVHRTLIILAASLSLMFATKEVSFIYVAVFGLFLVLLFFARLGVPRWQTPDWEQGSRILLWIALVALLASMLTFGLSNVLQEPEKAETEEIPLALEEILEPESESRRDRAADMLGQATPWAALATVVALSCYVVLLTLGSTSHQPLILTVLGVIAVTVLAMALLLFSLYIVELFPIHHSDCAQEALPGESRCPESDCKLIKERCQRPVPVVTDKRVTRYDETGRAYTVVEKATEYDASGTRIAIRLSQFEIVVLIVLIAVVTLVAGSGVYIVLEQLMPFRRGQRPVLDLIIFIGSFTLPFAAALAINGLPGAVSRLLFGIDVTFKPLDYSDAGLLRSAGFVFILLAVSAAAGLWWDWRRWLPAAVVFYVIFIVLFTTVFTNGSGLASGIVGSLGYWVEQQEVERGSQPLYYYVLMVPLYEYLPLIGFIAALFYILIYGLRTKSKETNPLETPFVLFLLCWTILSWGAYSVAGEKMPWLTTHFAVPMALATGWVVGKLLEGVDWLAILRRGGWTVILITPVGLAALVQVVSPWLRPGASKPFSGYELRQLDVTLEFMAALLILAISTGVLYWATRRIGLSAMGRTLAALSWGVLVVLTIRTAWILAYVNYDYASEFLVYAHSTPDVREVMEQVEDISRRTTGDLSLDIAYTSDGSYPFIWYLRNYPNAVMLSKSPSREELDKPVIIAGDAEWSGIEPYLGDNYTCSQYNFLWWPMQDYWNLSWERVSYAITNPEMRAALWEIIFRRDYRRYERVLEKIESYPRKVRLSEWPLRDGFRFCIRRDVTARVWSESAGPVELMPQVSDVGPGLPDYAGLERLVAAELVVSDLGPWGNWSGPHDMALDDDGFIYVADSDNHRVVKLSPEGQVVDVWQSSWLSGLQSWQPGCLDASGRSLALGEGEFCEPWGITVGPDNKVYVADTWNHRVQVFTTAGQFLGQFGQFGQSGASPSSAPFLFYGPRDVAVDEQGRIYVSDTGNKRVQVFDQYFDHQFSFGGPGIIAGRLEEPVGLVIGPDKLLYVADTWNIRLQIFTLAGTSEREWPISGWESQSVANKPYLATDSAGRVYVSDPEGSRVIVFDAVGTPLVVLGGPGSNLFQLPTGVLLDDQDRLWVSDAAYQRLLRFPALTFDDEGPVQVNE